MVEIDHVPEPSELRSSGARFVDVIRRKGVGSLIWHGKERELVVEGMVVEEVEGNTRRGCLFILAGGRVGGSSCHVLLIRLTNR